MATCRSTTRTLAASILFVLWVSGAAQIQQTCQTLPGFDIANLTIPDYWVLYIDECPFGNARYSCNLTIAFCKPLMAPAACVDSGSCLTYYNGSELTSTSFGHFSQTPFLGSEGFAMVADYHNGDKYPYQPQGKPCNMSSQLILSCNASVPWIPTGTVAVPPAPIYTNFDPIGCQITVQFVYAGGCYTSPTTTATTTTQSLATTPHGLSVLSFLFLLLLAVMHPYVFRI